MKQHSNKTYTRRSFLGSASCAAVGTATMFTSLFNLGMANVLAGTRTRDLYKSEEDDYQALVCILLAGGNDSYNMLVPYDDESHALYQSTRSNLALSKEDLLPLDFDPGEGKKYAIHPSMPEVVKLFDEGKLAFLSNVGTLIEPISSVNAYNSSIRLPLGLFSHADQIQQWQTSVPQERSALGWGGRMADILGEMNSNPDLSMNISLSGNNVFQSGNQTVEYTIVPYGNGSIGIKGLDSPDPFNQLQSTAVKSLLEQEYQDIFKQTYTRIIRKAQTNHTSFSDAIDTVRLNTIFSPNYVSQSLHMIARVIGARQQLGMKRQTFFLTYGGWDHHDEVLNNQLEMLGILSRGLSEFQTAMDELGTGTQVTTFTISDFSRTLTSNGNGTDHAWGGNVLAMGDSVRGGNIYGKYPELALNSSLDVGNGILLPTTSCDEYFTELALWFGVSPSDLPLIFPNIGNFYTTGRGELPIGFMNI